MLFCCSQSGYASGVGNWKIFFKHDIFYIEYTLAYSSEL